MKIYFRLRWLVVSLLFLAWSQWSSRAHSAFEEMAEAANRFLVALTGEQRAQATFDFKQEERFNWHFIPKDRKGLPLKQMTPDQRHLAYGLLNSGLSQQGFGKVTAIMSLEQILKEIEQGRGPNRDPELYFFSIFGLPGAQATWGWRVEGHHLSLNFTIIGGKEVSVTPSFLGSNPGEVRQGPRRGLRVLAPDEDLARQLASSLDETQKKSAIFSETAPKDIITSNARKINPLEPAGLPVSKMNAEQKTVLLRLVQEYVNRYRQELAAQDLKKIDQADWAKVHFAWAGGLPAGQGHYYRVQGPTFLMEYDNTQNEANHIHAVWRDLTNDFGDDLLRRHYEQNPHPR